MGGLSPLAATGGPMFATAFGPSPTPGGFSGRSFGAPALPFGFGFPSFGDPLFYFQPASSGFFLNRLLGYANGSAVNINTGPVPSTLGFGGLLLGMPYYADSGVPGAGPFEAGSLGSFGGGDLLGGGGTAPAPGLIPGMGNENPALAGMGGQAPGGIPLSSLAGGGQNPYFPLTVGTPPINPMTAMGGDPMLGPGGLGGLPIEALQQQQPKKSSSSSLSKMLMPILLMMLLNRQAPANNAA